MVDVSENVKWGYAVEAAYAAGAGTAEYDQTELTSASSMDYPADSFTLPLTTYERQVLTGYNLNSSVVYTKGVKYADSSFPMYVQTANWISGALNDTSYAIYYHTPALGVRNAFGCVISKYKLSAGGDDFPKQTVDFMYYSVSGATQLASEPEPLETTPVSHRDLQVTVDGSGICVSSLSFSIENDRVDEMAVGCFARVKPALKDRKVTFEIEAYEGVSGLIDDPDDAVASSHSITVTVGSVFTLSGSGVTVTDAKREEIPGKRDVFKYKITMEGGSWTI